jgi:hypothetical protein
MLFDARARIVREAIDVVLRRLEGVAPSDKTERLRAWAHECLQETDRWSASPPTTRERDTLMKRVLALHVEVTKLERDPERAPVADSAAPG